MTEATSQRCGPSPVRQGRCVLPDASVAYEVSGSGPPLMMIMGYLARGSAWVTQRAALEGRYTVLTFDHVGVGDSDGLSPSSMRGFVQVCLALLDREGWTSAHIVGVSMGGMIAQHLALTSPERVRSLSLIVTHAGGVGSVIPPVRGLPHFLSLQLARSSSARHHALMRLLIPPERLEQLDRAEVLKQLARDFSPLPPRQVRLAQLKAVLGHKVQGQLGTLSLPVLVISADQDLLVAPKHQRRLLRHLPHATFVRYPQAGHGLIRQQDIDLPERLAAHMGGAELIWAERSGV